MERRSSLLLCLLVIAGLLLTGTASGAEAVLPLGTDGQGMHLDVKRVGTPPHRHGELVLTFDASAADRYRQIAGRAFVISCWHLAPRPTFLEFDSGVTTEQRAPRRRRPIRLGIEGGYDYCTVGVRHRLRTTVLAEIPLTPRGARHLDERITARRVVAAVNLLSRRDRPSAAMIAAQLHGVALASPAQAPPPGVLGVYSDGADHVYAAQTDRGGKLIFLEQDGNVTRTNVIATLIDDDAPAGAGQR